MPIYFSDLSFMKYSEPLLEESTITQGSHERLQETERESLPLDINGERTPSLKSSQSPGWRFLQGDIGKVLLVSELLFLVE